MAGQLCDQVVSWSKFPFPWGPRQWEDWAKVGKARRRKVRIWDLITKFERLA